MAARNGAAPRAPTQLELACARGRHTQPRRTFRGEPFVTARTRNARDIEPRAGRAEARAPDHHPSPGTDPARQLQTGRSGMGCVGHKGPRHLSGQPQLRRPRGTWPLKARMRARAQKEARAAQRRDPAIADRPAAEPQTKHKPRTHPDPTDTLRRQASATPSRSSAGRRCRGPRAGAWAMRTTPP